MPYQKRTTRRRNIETEDDTPATTCAECASLDPQIRSTHHLALAKALELDAVRAHLTPYYVHSRDEHKQRPDLVDDIVDWLATVKEQYSGLADPDTGAKLPWWTVRQQMMDGHEAAARAAYGRAPEGFLAKAHAEEDRDRRWIPRTPTPLPETPFPDEPPYPPPPHTAYVEVEPGADVGEEDEALWASGR